MAKNVQQGAVCQKTRSARHSAFLFLFLHAPNICSSSLLRSSFFLLLWQDKTKWKVSEHGIWQLGTVWRLWMDGCGWLLACSPSSQKISLQLASPSKNCGPGTLPKVLRVVHNTMAAGGWRWGGQNSHGQQWDQNLWGCPLWWYIVSPKPTPSEAGLYPTLLAGLWDLALWLLLSNDPKCTRGPL